MRTVQPHLALHRLFRVKSELQEVYMNQVMNSFAVSLIGIFVPIYLLTLGFALVTVIGFLAIYYAGLGLLTPFFGRFASKAGLKHVILYSAPMTVLYYILLVAIEHFTLGWEVLMAVGLLGGISFGMYWVSLNAEFVKNSHKIHRGMETARLIAYPKLAAIVAPVIGAFLITSWGYDVLFVMVMVILGLSIAPLFATNDYRGYFRFRLRDTRLLMKWRYMMAFFARGVSFIVELVIWPIFIFVSFSDLMAVGIAAMLSGIGITFFTLFVGRISDRVSKKVLVRMGGLGYFFVWMSRLFVTTELEVFILSLLGGMLMTMIAVALFSSFSDMAKRGSIVGSVVSREMWLSIGRIVGMVLLIMAAGSFQFAFVLAGLVSLLFLLF